MCEAMGDVYTAQNVWMAQGAGGDGLVPGTLKVTRDGLGFKARGAGGAVTELPSGDVGSLAWTQSPPGFGYQVTVGARIGGNRYRLRGLPPEARERIEGLVKDGGGWGAVTDPGTGKAFRERTLSAAGWNWGKGEVGGNILSLRHPREMGTCLDVNLSAVTQVTVQGKTDVVLELGGDDVGGGGGPEEKYRVTEMVFHVPKDYTGSFAEGVPDDDDVDPDAEETPADRFADRLRSKANIQSAGEAHASFENLALLVPRGRFDADLYGKSLRLQGTTQSFTVPYSAISLLTLLAKPDGRHHLLMVSVEPPIRKGQTVYDHLIFQFADDQVIELALRGGITERDCEDKYAGKLKMEYDDNEGLVFSSILRGLADARLVTSDRCSFSAASGAKCVRCSVRADEGLLYPMEKSLVYLHKPTVRIAYDDIRGVEFERAQSLDMRSFELTVDAKTEERPITFRNIAKDEYSALFNFFQAKKVKIRNLKASAPQAVAALGRPSRRGGAAADAAVAMELDEDDEDEEEDEDFEGGSDDSDDDASSEEEGDDDDDDEDEDEDEDDDDEAAKKPSKKARKG